MNVQVFHDGANITQYCIEYEREHKLCTMIGIIKLSFSGNISGSFNPWDEIDIYEDGDFKSTYYVSSFGPSQPDGKFTVEAQDNSKRLTDYFIAESYLVNYPSYSRDWLEKFLTEAGISYEFKTSDRGNLLSNNTALGMMTAYDQVMMMLQIGGMYLYFKANGVAVIGSLDVDYGHPKFSLGTRTITDIKVIQHDRMLRNRVVVWGNTNPITGEWIYSDVSKKTPWNYDSKDLRAIVISNTNIPNTQSANGVAMKVLTEFARITVEKHIDIPGSRIVTIGDVVRVSTKVFRGTGMVTTHGSVMSRSGLLTKIILDERCPRLFAFFNYGDYVYAGTTDSGVWRKQIEYDHFWQDFSSGVLNDHPGISDLFVRNGLATSVTFSGMASYTFTGSGGGNWIEIPIGNLPTISVSGEATILESATARAIIQDKSINNIRILADTYDGPNYKNYLEMYEKRFLTTYSGLLIMSSGVTIPSGSRAWVLDVSLSGEGIVSGNTIIMEDLTYQAYPIFVSGFVAGSGFYNILGLDIENDGKYDYVSVLAQRPFIVYTMTRVSSGSYLTGVDLSVGTAVSHIPFSGIFSTTTPEDIYGYNVGNMFSQFSLTLPPEKTMLLNNHYVNGSVETSASGDYNLGYGDAESYFTDSIVSLQGIPNGLSLNATTVAAGHTHLTDKILDHVVLSWNSSTTTATIRTYSFTPSGYVLTNTSSVSLSGRQPLGNHFYRTESGNWKCASTRVSGGSLVLSVVTITRTGFTSVDIKSVVDTTQISFQFANRNLVYVLYGTQGHFTDGTLPTQLTIVNLTTGYLNYDSSIFDGIDLVELEAGGARYTIRVSQYFDTYQVVGLALVLRTEGSDNTAAIHSIFGRAGIASLGSELYKYNYDIDQILESYFVQFSRKWSCMYHTATEKNEVLGDVGDPKKTIMSFGPNGSTVLHPLISKLGFQDFTDYPWGPTGTLAQGPDEPNTTVIEDPSFDEMSLITDATGLHVTRVPFTTKGIQLGLGGHTLASRPFIRPEMSIVDTFMVLRRDGETFDIITGGNEPYRLDVSNYSPLLTANRHKYSFEDFYVHTSGVLQVSQPTPFFGSGVFDNLLEVEDYRYTSFESMAQAGSGYQILFTTTSGLWLTPIDTLSGMVLYSGYVTGLNAGLFAGSLSMIESTNYSWPDQYIFMSSIEGGFSNFYQKTPSGVFTEYSQEYGLPSTEITIIRVEDIL